MERLTKRWPEGSGMISGRAICEFNHCPEDVGCNECVYGRKNNRLANIEDILGNEYDLDKLRELVEADRDGRCVVLPDRQHTSEDGENALKSAMNTCYYHNNPVTRYIADAVAEKLTREAAEDALKKECLK